MTKKGGIALLLILAGVAAAGYFIWVDYNYNRVAGYTEDGEYARALENMANVPDFYQDIKQLRDFDNAGLLLAAGNWDQAKQAFGALGTYRNADKMIAEADYVRAKKDLDAGNLDQAKQELTALGEYRDAKKLAARIDYLKAKNLIDQKDYKNGIPLLKAMPGDPDAADLLARTQESIYTESVQYYVNGNSGKADFSLVAGYKDADKYATLLMAKNLGAAKYEDMQKLSGFADANDIIMSRFLLDYLNGSWADSSRNVNFTMQKQAENWTKWAITSNLLSGKNIKIMLANKMMLAGDGKTWKYVFGFTFISLNEMRLTDLQTGQDYHLVRVKTP